MESIQLNLSFRKTETQSEDVSVKEKNKNWKMLLMKVKRLNRLFKKRKRTIFIIYLIFWRKSCGRYKYYETSHYVGLFKQNETRSVCNYSDTKRLL